MAIGLKGSYFVKQVHTLKSLRHGTGCTFPISKSLSTPRSAEVLYTMLDMNPPLPKVSLYLLRLKTLKLSHLTGLEMTMWIDPISSSVQVRDKGQHRPESSPGSYGVSAQSQMGRRRRWSKSGYACISTPVLPFLFPPSGGVKMIMDEPRTSSLQGKCVRICYSWYFTEVPLLTSYPNGVAVKIFCEKMLLDPSGFESWSDCVVAWHDISREIARVWTDWTSNLTCSPKIVCGCSVAWEKACGLLTLQWS